MRILLSGYQPFGGRTVNTSWDFLDPAPADFNGHVIEKVRLPVVHREAGRVLDEAIQRFRPDAVLGFGESKETFFQLERVAVNLADFTRPDNAGLQPRETPLVPGGPAAYFSALPLQKIHAALQTAGIPAEFSLSAGAYLCNEIYYHIMTRATERRLAMAGFIHVPRIPDEPAQAKADMEAVYAKQPILAILSALPTKAAG